jgi:hypothetical protein
MLKVTSFIFLKCLNAVRILCKDSSRRPEIFQSSSIVMTSDAFLPEIAAAGVRKLAGGDDGTRIDAATAGAGREGGASPLRPCKKN